VTSLTFRDYDLEQLEEQVSALTEALTKYPGHTLADWSSEIRRLGRALEGARRTAEAREGLAKAYPRDTQRSRVYRAEHALERPKVPGLAEQRHYVAQVMATDWFRAWFPELTVDAITFTTMHSRTAAGTHRGSRQHHEITFLPAVTDLTMLHELAHACHYHWYAGHGVAAHGPEFVGILLWLVVSHLGKDTGRAFAQGMITAGVKYRHVHQQRRTTKPADPIRRLLAAQER